MFNADEKSREIRVKMALNNESFAGICVVPFLCCIISVEPLYYVNSLCILKY